MEGKVLTKEGGDGCFKGWGDKNMFLALGQREEIKSKETVTSRTQNSRPGIGKLFLKRAR